MKTGLKHSIYAVLLTATHIPLCAVKLNNTTSKPLTCSVVWPKPGQELVAPECVTMLKHTFELLPGKEESMDGFFTCRPAWLDIVAGDKTIGTIDNVTSTLKKLGLSSVRSDDFVITIQTNSQGELCVNPTNVSSSFLSSASSAAAFLVLKGMTKGERSEQKNKAMTLQEESKATK